MQINISVRYFAMFRDLAGRSEERLSLSSGERASQVYLRLAEKYGFPLGLSDVRVAVNDDFTTGDHPMTDGDMLAFIPPVSGG